TSVSPHNGSTRPRNCTRPAFTPYSAAHAMPHDRASPDSTSAPAATLTAHWLAETLRLREAQWGHLEDARENMLARARGRSYTQKVLLRAQALGKREGLDDLLASLQRNARIALLILVAFATLAGILAAAAALGDGARSV